MTAPHINVTERTEGLIYWDGYDHVATLGHDHVTNIFKIVFINDPLGWGDREMLSETAARLIATAYIHELRAVRKRRQ